MKEFRESKGLTQKQLEDKTTIQQPIISDVENGKRAISTGMLYKLFTTFPSMTDRNKIVKIFIKLNGGKDED